MRSWRYCVNGTLIVIALIERSRQDFPAGESGKAGLVLRRPPRAPPAAEPDLLRQSRAATGLGIKTVPATRAERPVSVRSRWCIAAAAAHAWMMSARPLSPTITD